MHSSVSDVVFAILNELLLLTRLHLHFHCAAACASLMMKAAATANQSAPMMMTWTTACSTRVRAPRVLSPWVPALLHAASARPISLCRRRMTTATTLRRCCQKGCIHPGEWISLVGRVFARGGGYKYGIRSNSFNGNTSVLSSIREDALIVQTHTNANSTKQHSSFSCSIPLFLHSFCG